MRRRTLFATMLIGFTVVQSLRSQVPPQPETQPQFEVASVKQNTTCQGGPQTFDWSPSGRWTATCMPAGRLIQAAYADYQLRFEGLPDWARFERFDVVANAGPSLPEPGARLAGPVNLMIRSLLQERFKLTAHFEDRDARVYVLARARADRQLGPRLGPAMADCDLSEGTVAPGACGPGRVIGNAVGSTAVLRYGNVSMGALSWLLSMSVGTRVIDETGLMGGYKVDLEWTVRGNTGPAAPGVPPPPLPEGPSLFDAIQDQLGLKLESRQGKLPVLVIDRIERPTPD